MSEDEILAKYEPGTPGWAKDSIEYYTCSKHDKKTQYHRSSDIVVHAESETECF